MAVEIKELVIRAVIAPADGMDKPAAGAGEGSLEKQALIQACVEQVLKMLKKEKTR